MSEWTVKIEYKQKNPDTNELETVVEKEYDFHQYTEMVYQNIMNVLSEIENAFYSIAGGEQKKDWPPEIQNKFKSIRNKMLDQANAVRRLPQTLSYKGISPNQISFSEFLAKKLN